MSEFKDVAKQAMKRMTSGFWHEEKLRRKKTLEIAKQQGTDTTAAAHYLVSSAKQQIDTAANPEDEAQYRRVKSLFLSGHEENALGVLIDREKFQTMDESARQRYVFHLSSKLQEYRLRFEKEQQFNCQTLSMQV